MRMRIDSGNIDAKTLNEVKSETGSNALKSLMEKVVDLYKLDADKKQLEAIMKDSKTDIITLMKSLEVDTIEHKGVRCKLASKTTKTINEEALLEHCKSLDINGLVKTVEIVDMDVLENLIYTKQIEANSIEPFITKSISTFPKISGKLREDM